jgi:predicted transposase/invertase (TIGR01784 family)
MQKTKPNQVLHPSADAHGALPYKLTNDYLFRALLQKNQRVLKALLCSLLHLEEKDIVSVKIENEIKLGETINEKTFFLDVVVTLNGNTIINLEMQVINEHNWPDRSLSYICRSYNNLEAGEDYMFVRPAVQIGILDFTLFPEYPEFYATYQFLNVKNHTLYSDKLRLSVLDLNQIKLATEEDKLYGLDTWAALFKSTTWEEIHMLAKDNEIITEVADTVYKLTEDKNIRMQCEAREDYYRRMRANERRYKQVNEELADAKAELVDTKSELIDTKAALSNAESTITEMQSANAEKDNTITELHSENAELQSAISALQAEIERLTNAQKS